MVRVRTSYGRGRGVWLWAASASLCWAVEKTSRARIITRRNGARSVWKEKAAAEKQAKPSETPRTGHHRLGLWTNHTPMERGDGRHLHAGSHVLVWSVNSPPTETIASAGDKPSAYGTPVMADICALEGHTAVDSVTFPPTAKPSPRALGTHHPPMDAVMAALRRWRATRTLWNSVTFSRNKPSPRGHRQYHPPMERGDGRRCALGGHRDYSLISFPRRPNNRLGLFDKTILMERQ